MTEFKNLEGILKNGGSFYVQLDENGKFVAQVLSFEEKDGSGIRKPSIETLICESIADAIEFFADKKPEKPKPEKEACASVDFKNLDKFLQRAGEIQIGFNSEEKRLYIAFFPLGAGSRHWVESFDCANLSSALMEANKLRAAKEPEKPEPQKGEWWVSENNNALLILACGQKTVVAWDEKSSREVTLSIEKELIKRIPAPEGWFTGNDSNAV